MKKNLFHYETFIKLKFKKLLIILKHFRSKCKGVLGAVMAIKHLAGKEETKDLAFTQLSTKNFI